LDIGPRIAAAIFDADLKQNLLQGGSIANSIVALRGRSSAAPRSSCRERLSCHPRYAPSTRARRRIF